MSFFTPKGPLIPPTGSFQSLTVGTIRASAILAPNPISTFTTGVNPSGLAITSDGNYAYIANDNNYGISGSDSVTVLDLVNNIPVTTIHSDSFDQPYTITIDGDIAYVTNSNSPPTADDPGTITKIDITTNTVIGTLGTLTPTDGGFDGPSGLVIKDRIGYVNNYGGPGGLESGNGHTVSVVNIDTGVLITTIEMNDDVPLPPPASNAAPAAMAITPDGNYIYVANYVDGVTSNVKIIDTNNNTLLPVSITGLAGPFALAVSPDGLRVYVTNFGSNNFQPYGTSVKIIDTTTNTIVNSIELGIQPSGVAFTPDGKYVFVSNYNTLYAWTVTSLPAPYPVDDFPLPQYLNLTAGAGTINVIDAETETLIAPTITVGQSPNSLAVTPDGNYLLVTNYTSNTCQKISTSIINSN